MPTLEKRHFVVLSLPRSRSTWLSVWLSYGSKFVGHDIGVECNSIYDFESFFSSTNVGTVETGAAFAWKLLRQKYKLLIIHRDAREVIRSLEAVGLPGLEDDILTRQSHLTNAVNSGVPAFDWTDLSRERKAREIWEYLLRQPFDAEWWKRLEGRKINIDLKKQMERNLERRSQVLLLKQECFQRMEEKCLR